MSDNKSPHIPVLLEEVLGVFASIKEGVVVDCTLGFGGHSGALLRQNPHIKIIGIDRDCCALEFSKKALATFGDRFEAIPGAFGEKISEVIQSQGTNIRGVLADIGVSSVQLDDENRGFSFNSSTLDMRMDTQKSLDAKSIINSYSAYDLERIFRDYGEIKEAKKMASLITTRRSKQPFESAQDLSHFLQQHFRNPRIHPATLAFQAIRIEVNDELGELKRLLENATQLKNAIFGVITFHSLEDRMVKNAFKEWSKSCICDINAYKCECGNNHAKGVIITKKPLVANSKEIKQNPRSRSAKFRAFAFKD